MGDDEKTPEGTVLVSEAAVGAAAFATAVFEYAELNAGAPL